MDRVDTIESMLEQRFEKVFKKHFKKVLFEGSPYKQMNTHLGPVDRKITVADDTFASCANNLFKQLIDFYYCDDRWVLIKINDILVFTEENKITFDIEFYFRSDGERL